MINLQLARELYISHHEVYSQNQTTVLPETSDNQSFEHLNQFTIRQKENPPHRSFISSASGLVRFQNRFYVVADDEVALGVFSSDEIRPGTLCYLSHEPLPAEYKSRKKIKPDLEAILHIPSTNASGHGQILVIPSGSKINRVIGYLINLDIELRTAKPKMPRRIDFTELYTALLKLIPDLNIEGAVLDPPYFRLFQRGNAASNFNAMIDLDLKNMLSDLQGSGILRAQNILKITQVDLGQIHNVPLSFTDATISPSGELCFLAAAEKTDNTFDDGEYVGSQLGYLNREGKVLRTTTLNSPQKPEGISMSKIDNKLTIFIVTDADNPELPSQLLTGAL